MPSFKINLKNPFKPKLKRKRNELGNSKPGGQHRDATSLKATEGKPNQQLPLRSSLNEDNPANRPGSATDNAVPQESELDKPSVTDFEIKSSPLWDRAVAKVRLTDDWEALTKIQLARPFNFDKRVPLTGTAEPSSKDDRDQLPQLVNEVKVITGKHNNKSKNRKILEAICEKTLAIFSAANAPGLLGPPSTRMQHLLGAWFNIPCLLPRTMRLFGTYAGTTFLIWRSSLAITSCSKTSIRSPRALQRPESV
jgi:hypothetical protein